MLYHTVQMTSKEVIYSGLYRTVHFHTSELIRMIGSLTILLHHNRPAYICGCVEMNNTDGEERTTEICHDAVF